MSYREQSPPEPCKRHVYRWRLGGPMFFVAWRCARCGYIAGPFVSLWLDFFCGGPEDRE